MMFTNLADAHIQFSFHTKLRMDVSVGQSSKRALLLGQVPPVGNIQCCCQTDLSSLDYSGFFQTGRCPQWGIYCVDAPTNLSQLDYGGLFQS